MNSVCGDCGISSFAFIVNQYIQRTVNSVFAPPVNSVFAKVRFIVFLAKEIDRSPVSLGG